MYPDSLPCYTNSLISILRAILTNNAKIHSLVHYSRRVINTRYKRKGGDAKRKR